jgi:hypothetical protein
VDFILLIVRDTLKETGRDQIKIPSVNKNFSTDILFFPVLCRIRDEGGWLRNLSTVHRTSDTVAKTAGTNLSVVCGIGLQTLQLGYEHFVAILGSIETSGKITITVPHNAITIKVRN